MIPQAAGNADSAPRHSILKHQASCNHLPTVGEKQCGRPWPLIRSGKSSITVMTTLIDERSAVVQARLERQGDTSKIPVVAQESKCERPVRADRTCENCIMHSHPRPQEQKVRNAIRSAGATSQLRNSSLVILIGWIPGISWARANRTRRSCEWASRRRRPR